MTQDIESAAIGHVDVEDQKVPVAIAQAIERLLAAGGRAGLADRGVLSEELQQPGANYRVVVRYQDPGC